MWGVEIKIEFQMSQAFLRYFFFFFAKLSCYEDCEMDWLVLTPECMCEIDLRDHISSVWSVCANAQSVETHGLSWERNDNYRFTMTLYKLLLRQIEV